MTNRTVPSTRFSSSRSPGIRAFLRSPVTRCLGTLAVGASLFLVAKPASAQAWLRDRRTLEGQGLRAGDFEFHPGIGGEIGYDSNWFLRTHKTDPRFVNGAPQNPPTDGALLRLTPSLTLNTLRHKGETGLVAPSPVSFTAGISATYREFFGKQELRDQRNISGAANARLDVNNGRPVAFGIFANYQRLIQPAVVADPNLSFNRSDVGAGADVTITPGGGTLDLRAGYQFLGALFEESNGAPYTNFTHEISVRNRWRFRPRTALFHETTLRFITYPNADRALNYLNESTPLRTRFGVTGLLTERFGVLLAAGYGATFFKRPELVSTRQYDSVNAQAEGTFYLSQGAGTDEPGKATLLLSTISFGYVRDFQNSLLSNYYTSNKGYAKVVYMFGNSVLMSLDGYGEGLSYSQPFYNSAAGPVAVNGANGAPTGDFTNYRIGGTLFFEYRFSQSFGVNATFDYAQMISDVSLDAGAGTTPGGPSQLYDLSWRRFQAFAGVRYFF
jgi:hypothetical protein